MNINRSGIVLVVDSDRRLLGTITDGDVRRAILDGVSLEEPSSKLLSRKQGSTHAQPITAWEGTDSKTLLATLREFHIRHLPVIDRDQRVVGMVTLDEFVPPEPTPLEAVVMAGGFGIRLRPLTDQTPKSMLPIGERPLLEFTIEQLRQSGVSRVHLVTHYRKDLIAQYFGDGGDFGVEIKYVEEDEPLGTAGGLSLISVSDDPLLVINGDILTRVDFRAMLDFHREHKADMTVAVRQHEFQLPYGVVTTDGFSITSISEKPVLRHLISAGIYLLSPSLRSYIPVNKPYDMPDLIANVIADGCSVASFPVGEYWIDIGKLEDYRRALADVDRGVFRNAP
jgi:dTDP-glucose pyrophosphorylase